MANCDSEHECNGMMLGCWKRKGHKGYHKSGFYAW